MSDDENRKRVHQEDYDAAFSSKRAALGSSSGGTTTPTLYTDPESLLFKLLCPQSITGLIIGRKGSIINQLNQNTGAKIRLSQNSEFFPGTNDRILLISGSKECIANALSELVSRIAEAPDKKTTSSTDAYGNPLPAVNRGPQGTFQIRVLIPKNASAAIIGRKGSVIQRMGEVSSCKFQLGEENDPFNTRERILIINSMTVDHLVLGAQTLMSELLADARIRNYPNTTANYSSSYVMHSGTQQQQPSMTTSSQPQHQQQQQQQQQHTPNTATFKQSAPSPVATAPSVSPQYPPNMPMMSNGPPPLLPVMGHYGPPPGAYGMQPGMPPPNQYMQMQAAAAYNQAVQQHFPVNIQHHQMHPAAAMPPPHMYMMAHPHAHPQQYPMAPPMNNAGMPQPANYAPYGNSPMQQDNPAAHHPHAQYPMPAPMALPANMYGHANHGNHPNHVNHTNHGNHSNHSGHSNHVSHGSHANHSNHGNHSNHSSHTSHGTHMNVKK